MHNYCYSNRVIKKLEHLSYYLRRRSNTTRMTIAIKKTRPPTPPPIAATGKPGSFIPVCLFALSSGGVSVGFLFVLMTDGVSVDC